MTRMGARNPRVALLLPVFVVLAWAGAAQAQTLEEILDAAVAATGGREAIERIESVRRSGIFSMDTEFGVIGGDTEVVIKPNQRVYQAVTSDFFSQTTAWDGTVAWQFTDLEGTVELTGADATNLRNQTVLDWFDYQNPAFDDMQYAKAEDQEVAGRDHHVVEVSAGGIDYRYFLDKETHLVTQLIMGLDSSQLGSVEVTIRLSGYETFEGVVMATRSRLI